MTDNTTISKEVDVGDSQIEKSTTSTERKPSKQFQMGHIREAQKAQEGTLNERKIVAVKSDDGKYA